MASLICFCFSSLILNLRRFSSLVFGFRCGPTFRCSAGFQLWIRLDFLLCSGATFREVAWGRKDLRWRNAGELEMRKNVRIGIALLLRQAKLVGKILALGFEEKAGCKFYR